MQSNQVSHHPYSLFTVQVLFILQWCYLIQVMTMCVSSACLNNNNNKHCNSNTAHYYDPGILLHYDYFITIPLTYNDNECYGRLLLSSRETIDPEIRVPPPPLPFSLPLPPPQCSLLTTVSGSMVEHSEGHDHNRRLVNWHNLLSPLSPHTRGLTPIWHARIYMYMHATTE